MWCRNVAAGLASLRRPARARAATSIPPRSPMASKRPRKGPETKTMQNSPCRDHATTLRRPCNTLQSPLQKPCSTPGGGGGPEKKRPPGNPEKPSRRIRRGPLPQQKAKAQAPSRRLASKKRANCIWRSSIRSPCGRGGRPCGRRCLRPASNSLHVWDRDTSVFFHSNRRTCSCPSRGADGWPRRRMPARRTRFSLGRLWQTACHSVHLLSSSSSSFPSARSPSSSIPLHPLLPPYINISPPDGTGSQRSVSLQACAPTRGRPLLPARPRSRPSRGARAANARAQPSRETRGLPGRVSRGPGVCRRVPNSPCATPTSCQSPRTFPEIRRWARRRESS